MWPASFIGAKSVSAVVAIFGSFATINIEPSSMTAQAVEPGSSRTNSHIRFTTNGLCSNKT